MPLSLAEPSPVTPEPEPGAHARKWWVLVAVGIGTFMSALNSSIVNAVTPVLMRSLRVELETVEWITLIFLLLVSGLLLTFGRLGDLLGHKRVYLAGFVVFVLAATACGFSTDATTLIAGRAVQAVGSAMLLSNSPALLTRAFPARQRGQALGMQGTFTYLGLMIGPTVGGWLTEHAGWPSIFFLCVPFGLVALVLTWLVVADEPPAGRGEKFDLPGAAAFLVGLSALLLALSHGQPWGWASIRVVGLLALFAVALGIFFAIERRVASPMIDLSLFRIRIIGAASASALLNYICLYAVMFLVPFYLLHLRGLSPSHAGLLLSTQALVMALVAPLSGTLSDRIGSRLPASLGMAVITAGMILLATLEADASHPAIVARLALLGLGSGLFASPNNSALMGAAPRQRHGVAAAVLASARNVGMVLGVALAGAIFARAGGLASPSRFIPAFRETFLVLAAFGAAGILTSLARGPRSQLPSAPSSPPVG
jgi:EmrB/QacA subfamily drug resistance transporter